MKNLNELIWDVENVDDGDITPLLMVVTCIGVFCFWPPGQGPGPGPDPTPPVCTCANCNCNCRCRRP